MKSIAVSNIVTAFDTFTVGTKVNDSDTFWKVLHQAVLDYDWTSCREPGQGFIVMPQAIPLVSAGDGLHTEDSDDYHSYFYRGRMEQFLKRSCAGEAVFVACVVYTLEAYLADPDVVNENAEQTRMAGSDYVLVAVLANSGPGGPITPGRLVYNLAGHNNEYVLGDAKDINALEELMEFDTTIEVKNEETQRVVASVISDARHAHTFTSTAKESDEYWSKYSVVAG